MGLAVGRRGGEHNNIPPYATIRSFFGSNIPIVTIPFRNGGRRRSSTRIVLATVTEPEPFEKC